MRETVDLLLGQDTLPLDQGCKPHWSPAIATQSTRSDPMADSRPRLIGSCLFRLEGFEYGIEGQRGGDRSVWSCQVTRTFGVYWRFRPLIKSSSWSARAWTALIPSSASIKIRKFRSRSNSYRKSLPGWRLGSLPVLVRRPGGMFRRTHAPPIVSKG